jgi:hypothetical protein
MLKLLHIFLLFFFLNLVHPATAQTRQHYTGSNIVLVGLESVDGILEFASDNLQVRYIQETKQIECRLPVATLYNLNPAISSDLAYEVLYGAKFPEIIFYINAPNEILNSPRINQDPKQSGVTIEFQGTPNETRIPVMFASEKGVIIFSSSFDFRMSHFRATIPAKYLSLLSGRVLINIRNARWLNNPN